MRRILLIALFTLGSASITFAQEDVFTPAPIVVVEKSVNLRRDPSTTHPPIILLKPSTKLRLIDTKETNGFYRVIFGKGQVGWVWSKNIRREKAANLTFFAAGHNPPCVDTFDQCLPVGCGSPGSPQAILNTTKRRQPSDANALTLTFDDFRALQEKANDNDLVGQHNQLTQEERDLLRDLSVSSGTVSEGRLVKISGFIAEGLEPHPNTGESVNCSFTEPEHNDFHISIVPNTGDDEFKGIVVEMIPQGRNPGWTLGKLKNIREQGRQVLVVGALFYDNVHVVNDDPNHPVGGQPKRFSLWEVHPITQFFVCMGANNICSATSTDANSGWRRLEDF